MWSLDASGEQKVRLIFTLVQMKWIRHISFWLLYCSYFYIQSISPQNFDEFANYLTYRNAFVSLCCFVPFSIVASYICVDFILPFFIEQKRYWSAVAAFVILFSVGTGVNFFAAEIFFKMTDAKYARHKGALSLGYHNTTWAMIICGFAMGLKIARNWYLQQKEIEKITARKTRNELDLQKNNIHPEILYSGLNSIYHSLSINSERSPSMILTLSNVLSYSLYESKTERVALQSEINAVKDFISLEMMKHSVEIILRVDDDVDCESLSLAPMTILSAVQDKVIMLGKKGVMRWTIELFIDQTKEHIRLNLNEYTTESKDDNCCTPDVRLIAKHHLPVYEPA